MPQSVPDSVRVRLEVPERVDLGEPVKVILHLENVSDRVVDLFLLGLTITYDVVITGEDGRVIWRRLKDEVIPSILRVDTLKPGAAIELEHTWDQRTNGGAPVSAGEYTIRGEVFTEVEPLTTSSQLLRIGPL